MRLWADAFAGHRPVILFDQPGHGRTQDTSRPESDEQFADDAAALLRILHVQLADVTHYAQGGGVAMQMAIDHKSLVSHLVSPSATFRKDSGARRNPKTERRNVRRYNGVSGLHARPGGIRGGTVVRLRAID